MKYIILLSFICLNCIAQDNGYNQHKKNAYQIYLKSGSSINISQLQRNVRDARLILINKLRDAEDPDFSSIFERLKNARDLHKLSPSEETQKAFHIVSIDLDNYLINSIRTKDQYRTAYKKWHNKTSVLENKVFLSIKSISPAESRDYSTEIQALQQIRAPKTITYSDF